MNPRDEMTDDRTPPRKDSPMPNDPDPAPAATPDMDALVRDLRETNGDPKVWDLLDERDRLIIERDALRRAVEAFAKVASGIPDNWPGDAVLDWQYANPEHPERGLCLHYWPASHRHSEPTIDDYRRIAALAHGAGEPPPTGHRKADGTPPTDEQLERWKRARVKAVKARINSMPLCSGFDELRAVAAQIVLACADAGATDWPADLHLADVVEKHLMRAAGRD